MHLKNQLARKFYPLIMLVTWIILITFSRLCFLEESQKNLHRALNLNKN